MQTDSPQRRSGGWQENLIEAHTRTIDVIQTHRPLPARRLQPVPDRAREDELQHQDCSCQHRGGCTPRLQLGWKLHHRQDRQNEQQTAEGNQDHVDTDGRIAFAPIAKPLVPQLILALSGGDLGTRLC